MLDSPETIQRLLTLRTEYGPASETGAACSNLIEQIRNRSATTDPKQIEALDKFMAASIAKIAARPALLLESASCNGRQPATV